MSKWRYFIYVLCVLLLLAPFSETYVPRDETGGVWKQHFALNSFGYAWIVLPIIFLLTIIPLLGSMLLKRGAIIVLIVLAGIPFLLAIQSLTVPIQDFVPQWGMFVFVALFPVTIVNAVLEWPSSSRDLTSGQP